MGRLRDSIKSTINHLLGRPPEMSLMVEPWRNYQALEYGTRLDDLLFIPMLVMSYLPLTLVVLGVRLAPIVNIGLLLGSMVFFIFGIMVKNTWLANRIKTKYYGKATLRFPKGIDKEFQIAFAKTKYGSSFHRMDLDQYQKIRDAKNLEPTNKLPAPEATKSTMHASWVPYIFERKPLPMIVLMPCEAGQLDYTEGNVVEAGQTTKGPRAKFTMHYMQRTTMPSENLEPTPVDVFKMVESQWHYERQELVKDLVTKDLQQALKDIDEGTSIPLLSVIKQQEITIKDLNRQIETANWDSEKRADQRLKTLITGMDLVQPKSERREDWVKWVVILIIAGFVFVLGAVVVGLI